MIDNRLKNYVNVYNVMLNTILPSKIMTWFQISLLDGGAMQTLNW